MIRWFLFTLFLSVAGLPFGVAQKFSSRFELVKMEKNVNTHYHEAAPIVSPDGNTLYFFVDSHPENTYGKDGSQDIWVSRKNDKGEWGDAQHLKSPFNEHRSNQVFTVFDDGTLFIKGGRKKNEKGFSFILPNMQQVELKVDGFSDMNKGRFYGASMSADKKHMILYFGEREKSPLSDIYVSHEQSNGNWSRPKKLKISHSLDDFGPFISPDQNQLYYGSARPDPGKQGGVDIYVTKRLDNTWENWGPPVNLGPVINTAAMDAYISMDKNGNVFTSRANSRIDGGNLDLFILVPKDISIVLRGVVFNEKTRETIPANINITLPDQDPVNLKAPASGIFETKIPEVTSYKVKGSSPGFEPKELSFKIPALEKDTIIAVDVYLKPLAKKLMLAGNVYNQKTDALITAKLAIALRGNARVKFNTVAEGGNYEQGISQTGWYIFSASAEGFLNLNDSVEVRDTEITPVIKDLYLQPIEIGVTVRLKNIYFDFDKTTLKRESFTELDKVVDFLKQNASVEIEISGHTDSKGSDDYNLNLSQGRSQAVVDYLISKGIESFRLTAHGYGETKPIDTNDSDEGRANNRRVEFTVLKK